MDLLDVVMDETEPVEDGPHPGITDLPYSVAYHEQSHGPLHWNTRCSMELQEVVDNFQKEELYSLDFSVTVADPSRPDCPLVACSIGFTELTGYKVDEIVGRNCRFLLNGVPPNLIDDETRVRCRSFCRTVSQGVEYDGCSEVLPDGVSVDTMSELLPLGCLICVQTNATKSGELFRNMFYIKQMELDDAPYILGLQAGLPGDYEDVEGAQKLQKMCQAAWKYLDGNMAHIEQVLCSQFWYQASMRRQD